MLKENVSFFIIYVIISSLLKNIGVCLYKVLIFSLASSIDHPLIIQYLVNNVVLLVFKYFNESTNILLNKL